MDMTRRTFAKTGAVVAGGTYFTLKYGIPQLEDLGLVRSASAQDLPLVEDFVNTTCWIGKQDCGVIARRIDGRVVKLEGHPDFPLNKGTLCPKGISQIQALYDPNRVKTPLIRRNAKGVPGDFRTASWDEALTLVADKMNTARAKGPGYFVWQKGRSKGKEYYDNAFVNASGAVKLHHGAYCSDAGYRALEYTLGPHAVLHPDFRYTEYVLAWGWNVTNAGGNKLCWITWPRYLNEARERGMKMVAIDPRRRGSGPFADEWVPIRPGTDLALALALCHEVIERGVIDTPYLKKYTNSPYLVNTDGTIARKDGKELVWDTTTSAVVPFDTAGIDPALEGLFTVDGAPVQPAFALFKAHVSTSTAEWASVICGIPKEQVTKIADDIAKHANIGSTMRVDGIDVPYRPVGIMAYHVAQQELGFQAIRAMTMLMMLIGSPGAVGGQQADFKWTVHNNYAAWGDIKVNDGPYNLYLKESKFFPINSNNSSLVAKVMQDPAKYELKTMPEVLLIHMANPLASFASQKDIMASLLKYQFVAVIDPNLSLTADLTADVILPAAMMEKYEGPIGVKDPYNDAVALRIPVMAPMFQSRGDIDIYLDLCEKAGILFGEGKYLAQINKELGLKDPYTLPLDRKPTPREILEAWAQSQGIKEGVAYFEEHGVKQKGPITADKRYGYATKPAFGGAVHRLYGESLLVAQNKMKAKDVGAIYSQDYTAFPTWRTLTVDRSPGDFDLYLISPKKVEFKQSRASAIPLLLELAPKQQVEINPATAEARGIRDGDAVIVESHNALTQETRRVETIATYRESIRPDTVAMAHHYGETIRHPATEGQGPTPNELFFTGEGYVANTADQTFLVKVRVLPVGGA